MSGVQTTWTVFKDTYTQRKCLLKIAMSFILWLLLLVSASCTVLELDEDTAYCNGIDLREITIREVHLHYLTGRLTVQNVTDCYLNRIHALNPTLNAVISTNPNAHLDAIKLDLKMRRGEWGSLYGIPILVKDNIAVDGMQTTAGTLFLKDIFPKQEAIVVKRLRKHGAIILGKTNLSELSGCQGGATRFPYNLTGKVYGSSSGSAAAVAANLALGALGTETVGSIICPSSVTWVFGFKPTFNKRQNQGLIHVAKSLDSIGVIARTSRDTDILANAIAFRKHSLYILKNPAIGILRFPRFEASFPEHVALITHRLEQLDGVRVIPNIEFTMPYEYIKNITLGIFAEFHQDIKDYLAQSPNPNLKDVRSIVEWYKTNPTTRTFQLKALKRVANLTPLEIFTFKKKLLTIKKRVREALSSLLASNSLDVIAIPSHCDLGGFTFPNIAGFPIINVPLGYSADATSISMAIFGNHNSDPLLLSLANMIETANPTPRVPPSFHQQI
ncbi:hypothetical protein DSO57_1006561 [Entomophthora muscae]|uniref:Uncharacterized protein n=1 Tax=Entomophthora muscae TaxID=34485 RepID=A0ACC2TV46_9FUNG|nr:hypothetical protein DSO57_1006561 [Entomophthora muscae]